MPRCEWQKKSTTDRKKIRPYTGSLQVTPRITETTERINTMAHRNWQMKLPQNEPVVHSTHSQLFDWEHLLSCNLLLFTFSFHLCPLKACPLPLCRSKKSSVLTLSKPFTILKTWIKSPRTLLFSSDVIPNSFDLSSYGLCFKPLTSLVALRWTFSKQSIIIIITWFI